MIVYCLTNTENGKRYIGRTSASLSHRWNMHKGDARRGSRNPLHKSIKKYGEKAFEMKIVASFTSLRSLLRAERRMIVEFKTHVSTGLGYNATWGGDGTEAGAKHPWFGQHHTTASKRKISASKIGKKNPSYKCRGKLHWNTGLTRSKETKQKIRISLAEFRRAA